MYLEEYGMIYKKRVYTQKLISKNKDCIKTLKQRLKGSKINFNYECETTSLLTVPSSGITKESYQEKQIEYTYRKVEQELNYRVVDNEIWEQELFLIDMRLKDYQNIIDEFFDNQERSFFDELKSMFLLTEKTKLAQSDRRLMSRIEKKFQQYLPKR